MIVVPCRHHDAWGLGGAHGLKLDGQWGFIHTWVCFSRPPFALRKFLDLCRPACLTCKFESQDQIGGAVKCNSHLCGLRTQLGGTASNDTDKHSSQIVNPHKPYIIHVNNTCGVVIVPTNTQTMMMNQILSWLMIRLTMTTTEGSCLVVPNVPCWEASGRSVLRSKGGIWRQVVVKRPWSSDGQSYHQGFGHLGK